MEAFRAIVSTLWLTAWVGISACGSNGAVDADNGTAGPDGDVDVRPTSPDGGFPVEPHDDDPWADVSSGSDHTCGVKTDGRLFCWGRGNSGRLGVGDTSFRYLPAQEATGADDWAQVSASMLHTCAVKADGGLYCWGRGDQGQLGNDATAESHAPVQVASDEQDWAQVSAGVSHTCGVKADERLFCWGRGGFGQLGADAATVSHVPLQEATGAQDWAEVSAGDEYTCGVKTDGRLYCWGRGSEGRLGTDSTDASRVPAQEATGAQDWAQVSAGTEHACGVKTDGRLYCWGNGTSGRLGDDSTDGSMVPIQEHSGGNDWVQVSAGSNFTCGVKADGRVLCWGANGALGIGAPPLPVTARR